MQWFRGSSRAPPPFISSEPSLRTKPLPEPPLGVTCDSPADPNRVGPSQPPPSALLMGTAALCFGGGGCKGLRGGWGKETRAWGSGDEKVVGKIFELLFNAGLSEEQVRDPALPRRWQSKGLLGQGGGLFNKFHPPPPSWKVSLRSGTSTQ